MTQLGELAKLIDGQLIGDSQLEISGATILRNSTNSKSNSRGQITLAMSQKYYDVFASSDAAAAVVSPDVELQSDSTVIIVSDPEAAFCKIVSHFSPPIARKHIGISDQAIVSPSALIADDVSIYPGAVIMDGVKIGCGSVIHSNTTVLENCVVGSNTTVFPNCTLYENTVVGDRVILHAGVVLGAFGFGYKSTATGHELSSQLGNVIIGNDVEIGANTTIDRGTFDATTIGDGTKIDDLVMIGHNCDIGKHNLLCSQVGIAGSSTTGDFVVMGGQVGVGDHLDIGSNVLIGAKSGLMHNIESDQKFFGIPARPAREQMQIIASIGKLTEMRKKLKSLTRKIDSLTAAIQGNENSQSNDSKRDAA